MTVWKFKMSPNCELEMPLEAQILGVHEQNDEICLWAMVNPDAPKVHRTFHVAGTGHILPTGNIQHLGTAYLPDECGQPAQLVLHVFEVL